MAWSVTRRVPLFLCLVVPFVCGCSMKALTIRSMEPVMQDMDLAVNRSTDVETLRDALPLEGAERLAEFMIEFEKTHS